jgi:uncharacterized protein
LERDIFRFGTATSVLLRGGALAGGARRGSGWFVELARKTGPARVQDLVGVVGREVVEPLAAVDAQPGAVLGADRGEGQGEDDGVPQQRLEVEDVALDPADLVLLARRLRGAARVGVQLLDVELQRVLEGLEAAGARTGERHLDVPVVGSCARCLEPVEDTLELDAQELFAYEGSTTEATSEEEEVRRVDGDFLDLEPMVRDLVVVSLPLSPVCSEDCSGLCVDCGQRLDDLPPDHTHEVLDPRWAGLAQRFASSSGTPGENNPEEN